MVIAGAGLCALGVDHFILRPDGGLSSAAAAIVNAADSPLIANVGGAASKESIDRSSASIAERLERLPAEAKAPDRDAFSEPWQAVSVFETLVADAPIEPASLADQPAPWKLTSVSSIGGKIAVVLDRDIVLTMGVKTRNDVELVDAAATHGSAPWARLRALSTGKEYLLTLKPQATSEKE